MSDKVEYSRLLLKRSNTAGVVPTIPPVSATTLNQFTPTDLFVGEMFVNVEDDRAWVRTNNDIIEFNFTGGTSGSTVIPTLTQVLNSGNTTGGFDILFPSGSKPVYTGLASGATTQFLGIDADGATIIVTGSTGGSGTSGTSGINGTNGTSGSSGINGTSGSSGISGAGSDGTIYGRWQFSSGSTAWSNPGTGRVITNSTNPNSVTRISIADTAQNSIYYGQLFDVIQSSYNSGASVLIQLQEIGSTNQPIIFTVGSMTGDTSWRNFGVAISVLGASSFNSNAIYSVSFEIYGQTGASGTSGSSGTSGVNGTSGSSGINGTSGSSGVSGTSGTSGIGSSGSSGTSGLSGVNGTSGTSGSSGINGGTGSSGTSGSSGINGTSGTSGGGGGGVTGTHFAWELSPGFRYNTSLTSQYHEIEWNLWANAMTLFPFTPARDVTVSALTMNTTFTAGTPNTPQVVMCVYDHNVATNFPGNLILSSSTITLQFPFVEHAYAVNYTFSAGTTYWLGYGFNNMGSVTAGFAVTYDGLMTFASSQSHCCDEPYKVAQNTSYTFPNLPNPFTGGSRYTGNANIPEICIKPSA